jgi:hypothetical protein
MGKKESHDILKEEYIWEGIIVIHILYSKTLMIKIFRLCHSSGS